MCLHNYKNQCTEIFGKYIFIGTVVSPPVETIRIDFKCQVILV